MKTGWKPEKNEKLKTERNVSFPQVELEIAEGRMIDLIQHPSPLHPEQYIIVVELNGEIHAVPTNLQENGIWFLWTIYPSKALSKIYGRK